MGPSIPSMYKFKYRQSPLNFNVWSTVIQRVVPIHVKTTGDEILLFFLTEMRLLFFSTLEATHFFLLLIIVFSILSHLVWPFIHLNILIFAKLSLHAIDSDIQNPLRKLVCKRESNVSPGTNINCKNTIYIVL